MTYRSSSNTTLDKGMNPEQFNQVIEAILVGKYSWACVLILRFSGYNPLQYIPYRTHNRLLKENCQVGRSSQHEPDSINTKHQGTITLSDHRATNNRLSKIPDLDYLEAVGEPHARLRGGFLQEWFPNQEGCSPQVEWGIQKNSWFSFLK